MKKAKIIVEQEIDVPVGLIERIDHIAKKMERSQSEIARIAIEEWLEKAEERGRIIDNWLAK